MEEGDIRKRIRAILRENYDWIDDQEELYPEDLFGDESIQAMRDMEDEYGKENVAKFGDHEDVRKFVRDVTKPRQVAEAIVTDGGIEGGLEAEMSPKDQTFYLKRIVNKYKAHSEKIGSQGSPFEMRYWIPFEAANELRLAQISYEIDKVTNKEHSDYGKRFCVVIWSKV